MLNVLFFQGDSIQWYFIAKSREFQRPDKPGKDVSTIFFYITVIYRHLSNTFLWTISMLMFDLAYFTFRERENVSDV